MAWCHQATSHYLNQCWPRSLTPYSVTRPQWVNSLAPGDAVWHHRTGSIVLFHNDFPPGGEQPEQRISSYVMTTNFRFYSNISQILLLYKTWGCYNKFDSTKSFGVYYWYVKIPQCGYMENGLKDVAFYVQKHIAPWTICYNAPLVCDMPLWVPAFLKLVYYGSVNSLLPRTACWVKVKRIVCAHPWDCHKSCSAHFFRDTGLTHWLLGYLDRILKIQFFTLYNWLVSSDPLLIMPLDWWHRTLLMISQHWFR